jgi:hypothetical protein
VHTAKCLLTTVKLHCRVKDNSCKAVAIAFAKARDAIILPNQLQILYSSTIFWIEWVLNLPSTSQPFLTA